MTAIRRTLTVIRSAAAAYERGRPTYPPEVIDWLLPAARTRCWTSARERAS